MINDVKLIGMCMGVFARYISSRDYLANYKRNLMAVFANMQLKAIANGFFQNEFDNMFVHEALSRISDIDALYIDNLNDREDGMVIMSIQKFSRKLTPQFIMKLLSKKYTQIEIAEKLGISRRTVQRWSDGGDIKDPENVRKLIELYFDSEVETDEA